jgi:hypothetical protein
MHALCPRCHHPALTADISIQAMTARCRPCNLVFHLHAPPTPATNHPAAPPLPANFQVVTDTPDALDVSWRWNPWQAISGFVFVLIMFIIVSLPTTTRHGHVSHGPTLLLLPIAGVAIWVAYNALAAFCNRTTVTCDRNTLTIRHGPIPWSGNRTVHLHNLANLRTFHPLVRRRQSSYYAASLALSADRDGDTVRLLSNLSSPQAAWLLAKLLALQSP